MRLSTRALEQGDGDGAEDESQDWRSKREKKNEIEHWGFGARG